MKKLLKTIGPPVGALNARAVAEGGAQWDVVTKIAPVEPAGYEVRIELVHTHEGRVESRALPSIRGFGNPTDAATYALAWVHAWFYQPPEE